MGVLDRGNAIIAARETPAGRAYESRLIYFDCLVLMVGTLGLALHLPPLMYLAAGGHLFIGFLEAATKWIWAIFTTVALALGVALFLAAIYSAQVFYFGFPAESVVGFLKATWPQQLAAAVVAIGVLNKLFSLPGFVAELCKYLDQNPGAKF
jgi:hypothetical protein